MNDYSAKEANHILLVHGAWHGGWSWVDTPQRLRDLGFRVTVVDQLPSTAGDPTAGLRSDATYLRNILDSAGEPTVLVGHSYGGMVLSEVAGHPNVVHAIYIAGFAPVAGASLMDMAQHILPPFVVLDEASQFTSVLPEHAARVMASNAPSDSASAAHVARMVPQSALSAIELSATVGWGSVPVTYLLTERDEAVPTSGQELMAAGLGVIPVRVDSPHFPMYSDLDVVINLIERAARI